MGKFSVKVWKLLLEFALASSPKVGQSSDVVQICALKSNFFLISTICASESSSFNSSTATQLSKGGLFHLLELCT
jgi:hypothetical protein